MKENEKKYGAAEECPITLAIQVIGGKWKPIIIWGLISGPKRFGEIHRNIAGMSLKVLSRQLKDLESDGIIIRTSYGEVPPRVEYSLSGKGKSLILIMESLSTWSKENIKQATA
ncbi:winged helix-turn-helix transcriptional regulator [Pedobacter miscanthi]|uniref:Transcriptional regulator n=1 Tax=Pedobacter miscanthi TaxID=2259170 RepID=A0A366L1U9_9SPHI|nr:helix-turn-helix domain-containing protein [Pedobacter miscanthi]RBQ07847.1 transcriptional regulator [Pedobacter miscanthi]